MADYTGPLVPFSRQIMQEKHRLPEETHTEYTYRVSGALSDNDKEFRTLKNILGHMRFLPGGRIQTSVGSLKRTTAFNCFVSGTVYDTLKSIMAKATEAAETMRLGGGIGYDFSLIRPNGDRIRSLDSRASGPVSFMRIFDSVCQVIASSGNRKGAQMGVLRIDHPDIMEFIRAKRNADNLNRFNISIGVTDAFMRALETDTPFQLIFNGQVYDTVNPRHLWDEVMRSNWDWGEPGVVFLDTINRMNNLYYAERISATNPCAEQPLPPYGACLLGSFNLVKYIEPGQGYLGFRSNLIADVAPVVRAMDNVIDRTIYPLEEQELEAKQKRRMGLGVCGLANAGEMLGYRYGSPEFLEFEARTLYTLTNTAYAASAMLAKERGSFPLYKQDKYLAGSFIRTLPEDVRDLIEEHGIRNSHLISLAPTGSISLAADNVSSGIEPPYLIEYTRKVNLADGTQVEEKVQDYAWREWGIKGATSDDLTVDEHLNVLLTAQKYVDSAISKTINVGRDVSFHDFKEVYTRAWKGGAKGATTFRSEGKRYGILNAVKQNGEACFIDPETGNKTCG
jgi:ribonucleoside-diphosphate reductase alpha chain